MVKISSKARTEAIYILLKENKSNEEFSRLLMNGFVPDEIKGRYNELLSEYSTKYNSINDSQIDDAVYSNYFAKYPEKVIGVEVAGSGFINPIITKGNIQDIENVINFPLPFFDKKENKIDEPKKVEKPINEKMEEKIILSKNQELMIASKLSEQSKSKQENKGQSDIITIEESIKLYNPNISDAEIKGWVYYKRLFGNPMRGWEKYFLSTTSTKDTVVYSKDSFYLKNQQFQDVKLVPSNTLLGKKTKFKNEYADIVYYVIKTEDNELYYVPNNKVEEKESFNLAKESELIELVKQKGICYSNGEYMPIPFYTYGDIYKIKDRLIGTFSKETRKYEGGYISEIEEKFGKEIADWHIKLIDDAIKIKGEFYFDDVVESKRPFLSKENPISTNFLIKELNLESGVNFEKLFEERKNRRNRWEKYSQDTTYSLFDAFLEWFRVNVSDTDLDNTTKSNIIDYYFNNRNIQGSKDMTDKEKDEIRLNARISGEKFYSKFLATALLKEDVFALNQVFNRTYNSISKLNLDKVPVAFEANRKIFNIDFKLKPVQRDGIAFMATTNSGCLAYDVGFGKTLTAIHNLASLLKQGKVKRPLIAVPKPVYNNWIKEMFGYWTDGQSTSFEKFDGANFVNGALTGTKYKLNSWFNLNKNIDAKNELVDADTITLVSYEGFYKIGFSDNLTDELFDGIYSILDKGKTDQTEREKSKSEEKVKGFLGIGNKETILDIDVCGFDYLVFDEAHAFKNVFNSVPLDETQKNVWRLSQKAEPTRRAVKAFFHCLYMQKKYGGNVNLLTATPFTNSPLEIFSMLSLVGYETLAKYNLQNLYEFLTLFIETEVEYTVDATNNIVLNTVIKSFKNKNLMRDILYRHFDYQDDPEKSDIKRPCKINFPNKKVNTYLEMSELQQEAQNLVKIEAKSYSPQNRGAMGKALNWAKSNSFSPYLVPTIEGYDDLYEFVENSPKIKYTIDCIKTIKNWHEERGQECSGQVIYSNRGVKLFADFKKALEEYCRFKKKIKFGDDTVDEVEIITGGGTDDEVERKELIKDAFNAGAVKVVIGTSTIKEGVNLQKRGTVLYHLDLDWNPTDFKQLEGRIYRQGNKFKYVRIVVPLVQNTLDSFINQKLDEKGKRIATIWDKLDNSNSIEEHNAIDPLEIKFALIDDPEELYKMKYDKEKRIASKESEIASEKFKTLDTINRSIESFKSTMNYVSDDIQKTFDNHRNYAVYLNRYATSSDADNSDKKKALEILEKVEENVVLFEDYYNNGNFKSLFDSIRNLKVKSYQFYNKDGSSVTYEKLRDKYKADNVQYWGESFNKISDYYSKQLITEYSTMKKMERSVLQPYGLTVDDDFSELKTKFAQEATQKASLLVYFETPEYRERAMFDIEQELEKRRQQRGTVSDRVNEFANYNYLLSYPFDAESANECDLPTSEDKSNEIDIVLVQDTDNLEQITIDKINSNDIKKNKPVSKQHDLFILTNELKDKLARLKPFIPKNQYRVLQETVLEHEEPIRRIYEIVNNMPKTYSQDGLGNRAYVFLHYFYGSADWYITEKDKGNKLDKVMPDSSETLQAFGYADLGYGGEFGYISIDEIVDTNMVELDLYWNIKPLYEVLNEPQKTISEDDYLNIEMPVKNLAMKLNGVEIIEVEPKKEVVQDDSEAIARARRLRLLKLKLKSKK